ncbi:unnamed protein product [Caenorhabditis brenneri]
MEMEELFDLSHCSEKTQRYLKACYGKHLHLCVQISGDTHFSFYIKNQYDDTFDLCLKNTFFGSNQSKIYNSLREPFRQSHRTIQLSSSQTPLEGVTSMVHHFLESFDLEIGELFIDLDCVENQFCILLQSLLKERKTLKNFNITGSIDREQLKYLLENYTFVDSFVAEITPETPCNLNLNSKLIHLEPAEWLTVTNLLSMSFETCALNKVKFQLDDWVTILNAWRNGWNPKMYHLEIEGDLEYQSIVNHLSLGTIRENSVVRLAKFYSIYSTGSSCCAYEIKGGYDITREDGEVATVYGFDDWQNFVGFHVWDNQATIN